MNLKLLFCCLFLVALLTPAEPRRKGHNGHHHHHHDHHHPHDHHDHHGHHGPGHLKQKKWGRFLEILNDVFFQSDGDDDDEEEDDDPHDSDWLFKLQEPEGHCNPNPCHNNGECKEKNNKFKCDCPKPFKGRKCEKGPRRCRRGRCGRGECVLTSIPPFYECKCKEPFQPPRCTSFSVCNPNPCRNGGTCIRDGNDFDCQCPPGFRGRFCHVGPNDCYVDDGVLYRGNVSETDDGDECLHWNSHFILALGLDPFNASEDEDGLGPHNFCRNPDGEKMPWCFFRRGRRLFWDYCDVTACSEPTDVTPTEIVPTAPTPLPTKVPKPVTTEPSMTEKPTQAPKPVPTAASSTPAATPTTPPRQFSTCGNAQPKPAITRIFGGLKVSPGAIPWQVSVQVRPMNPNKAYSHVCGGVLIESCWVLTAGHCIEPGWDMQVKMGGLSLHMADPAEQTIKVEEAIRHENYRETRVSVYNDIGLLRLKGTDGVCANETQFVKTACLPDAQLPDGRECTISGWGTTEQSAFGSNHLLEADVLLINQETCSSPKVYGSVLDDSMFCAGYLQGGVDSCQGDSGGPLTCQQNNASVVYGLVSWGDQCGKQNKPGVYTRIVHFLDWIRSKTQAASP